MMKFGECVMEHILKGILPIFADGEVRFMIKHMPPFGD